MFRGLALAGVSMLVSALLLLGLPRRATDRGA
jgi:hypothetical protein